jgi:hypothetical protein
MRSIVLKSGFEIFDTCRAYGLAQLLHCLTRGVVAPVIRDAGQAFVVELQPAAAFSDLAKSEEWHAVLGQEAWQQVFLTYKARWTEQREKVRAVIEKKLQTILTDSRGGLSAELDGPCTLPGPLEPGAFKGLKGVTTTAYNEAATAVDEINWALACVGAVVAQRYRAQKVTGGKWEYYVTLPIPDLVRFSDFHAVRELVYGQGLAYRGLRNAVAHFSVLLAEAIRQRASGNPSLPLRFSGVLYFSLFPSRSQYKPAAGGVFQVGRLMDLALSGRPAVAEAFATWNYVFRRGSVQGGEDLAEAITEFVMAPSLESYYRHARVFLRYVTDRRKGVKQDNLYTEDALREVMNYAA